MTSSLCGGHQPPQPESRTSSTVTLTDSALVPTVSDPNPNRADQEQGNKGKPGPRDGSQELASFSGATTYVDENEEMVITSIRATNVVLGLGRIPAGFYTIVHHSGFEWRTENKRLPVNRNVIEWDGPIPIPSDPSAIVCVGIYASFEFQPILGDGEQLRMLTITVEQLLNYSAKESPFTFPDDRDVVSPCSSLSVDVKHWKHESGKTSALGVLEPYCSTTEPRCELEDATNEGHKAFSRYRKHGRKLDLEHSIEQFGRALNVCPLEHPCRPAAQSNLAMAKFTLCRVGDANLSFDLSLNLYRDALTSRPVGHLDRPSTLIQLATVHYGRFEKQRDEVDASQSEALLQEVVDLSSADSYENQAAVSMLQLHARLRVSLVQTGSRSSVEQDSASGITDVDSRSASIRLLRRFERFGGLDDLQRAISLLESSVQSTPIWDHQYLSGLVNLGGALWYRFRRIGKLGDLEQAILRYQDVVELTSDGHSQRFTRLNNLGNALFTRFENLGALSDLEQAISRHRNAVDLAPDGHPQKFICLDSLGSALRTRFKRLGERDDLEQAISTHRAAVELTPDGHPDRPGRLKNLAGAFLTRFEHFAEPSDLEQAISGYRDAVDLTPDDHPQKPGRLSNLGNAFRARFERFGELIDIDQAISSHRDAVVHTPDGHPLRPGRLRNLGNALLVRFDRLGELSDLEQGTSTHRDAVDLTPDGDLQKIARLDNLGSALLVRFQRHGGLSDLEDGVSLYRDAVDLIPDGHPHKPRWLSNIGSALTARFERLGELSDLEQGISRLRDAVFLTPDGHTIKSPRLRRLGAALFNRFERFGELDDLEQAIVVLRDVVDLTPDGHPSKPSYMSNLGNTFLTRFRRLKELGDLEKAVSTHWDVVGLTPDGHPSKPSYLNNLGVTFQVRFRHLGELSGLAQSISKFKDAVDLTPDGRPDKSRYLNNLGISLRYRFHCIGDLSDLEQAILVVRDAVDLTPDGHPDRPERLRNLGDIHRARFMHLREPGDLEQAIPLYLHAASASTGPISARVRASQEWITCARDLGHHSLLHAYSVAIGLIPQLAWIGLSLSQRYRELVRGADVVREAAAAALESGYPETAIEWLEQGRSIVWGELFQLRSSYDELSAAHPGHASRLRRLSTALEYAGAIREKSLSSLSEGPESEGHPATVSPGQEAEKYRAIAIERDKLLLEVRGLPGFERFLLHKEFSQLRASAHSGPVIILNAAESRCDALIVLSRSEGVIHVPLPSFTLGRSKGLQNTVNSLLGHARDVPGDEREGRAEQRSRVSWESILSVLWNCVVKPVLDALGFSTPGDLSRIFWCPTGPFTFLPIHAAGLYGTRFSEPGNKVFDFVVSSYIPTLSIFAPSPKPDPTSSGDLRFLAVRQPPSDGLSRLSGVDAELRYIKAIIHNSSSARTTLLESSLGTVEEVLALMKEADWVHFACHGVQDAGDPDKSGLCLANQRRLKLSDIIGLSRPRGGLAFLSACQTAMGDETLTDEAIHIAAGTLFAGYGGVVGTMWSISDRLAPLVAKDVYQQLFRDGTRPDSREAARALQNGVRRLRDSGASFAEWLPFIHVGL